MDIHIEHVQRHYTDTELLEFARKSAHCNSEVERLTDEKKQATEHFKALITENVGEMTELSKRINMGYEIIPTPCDVILNQPTRGMKQFIDRKTLDVIKTLPMTEADRQGGLFDDGE